MAVSWRWVVLCCHHLSPNHSVSKRIKSTKQIFIAALFASHFGFGSRCIKTIKIPKFICFIFINFWSFVCALKKSTIWELQIWGKTRGNPRMKNPPKTQAFGSGLLNARDPGRGAMGFHYWELTIKEGSILPGGPWNHPWNLYHFFVLSKEV